MTLPRATQGEHSDRGRARESVLVLEDSRIIATLLKKLLESEGFNVLVAADGSSGLKAAREGLPRLVVADFHMPGMNGLEVVKALRADPRTHNIPILMLSANDRADDRIEALAAGADDYVVKGDMRQLLYQIRSLMARTS